MITKTTSTNRHICTLLGLSKHIWTKKSVPHSQEIFMTEYKM